MKICYNCQTPNDDNAQFCVRCNAPFTAPPVGNPAYPQNQPYPNEPISRPPNGMYQQEPISHPPYGNVYSPESNSQPGYYNAQYGGQNQYIQQPMGYMPNSQPYPQGMQQRMQPEQQMSGMSPKSISSPVNRGSAFVNFFSRLWDKKMLVHTVILYGLCVYAMVMTVLFILAHYDIIGAYF